MLTSTCKHEDKMEGVDDITFAVKRSLIIAVVCSASVV
jgi:hypothetical protein